MPRITKRLVDALKPRATSDAFLWDSELKGFGVRVKPTGAGAYLIQYRNAEGRTRRLVVGKAGTLTTEEARGIARDKLASVARGGDPSAERHAAREAITVAELCDWYLAQAAAGRLLGRNGAAIKPTTLAMDRSRIETHVKPLLGPRAVRSLKLHEIEEFQAQIASGKTAKARAPGRGGVSTGGGAVAGRTVGMLHAILRQAVRKKLVAGNPAEGVRKVASKRRRLRLSVEDLERLGAAMRDAAGKGANATGLAAVRALLLTGFRRREVLGMRREWLGETRAGGFVSFPDTKTGSQVRPIGRAALASLRSGLSSSEWIFPADRGAGHFIGIVKVLNRVVRIAGLRNVTPHVLRHTFASIAGDLGFTKLTIAGLLGHATRGDTESYVHLDTALLAAANRVADFIAGALDGVEGGSNVVELQSPGDSDVRRSTAM